MSGLFPHKPLNLSKEVHFYVSDHTARDIIEFYVCMQMHELICSSSET